VLGAGGAPRRVIDTRLPGAGGKFAGGETRSYVLRGPTTDYTSQGGNAAGCGIPGLGGTTVQENVAKALALNVIVVAPTAAGDMRAWPANQPVPLASVINYTNISGFNIANGVIVPMCDEQSATPCSTGDISFKADVAGGFLVADVTGYFHEESSDITSVNAGTGLSGGGSSGDVTLSLDAAFQLPQACGDGQVAKWSAGAGAWICADDAVNPGTITSVTAGPGLTGGGASGGVSLALGPSFQLPQTCANGQVAVWKSGAGQWQCANNSAGGAGFGKGDLYENVQTKSIAEGSTATVTVACNDANDLPLEGTCRPLPPAGDVLVQGERTIDWTSTSAAAKFECTFTSGEDDDEHDDALAVAHRDDPAHGGGTHDVQARIVCIAVP
jgi:hypothetical protein